MQMEQVAQVQSSWTQTQTNLTTGAGTTVLPFDCILRSDGRRQRSVGDHPELPGLGRRPRRRR